MKNKKGFLLGESTLKIIIAVIAIGLLLLLLYKLYDSFSGSAKIREARETLDKIIEKMNLLEKGESVNLVLVKPTPGGATPWYVVYFSENDDRPSKCVDEKNCLCICRFVLPMMSWKDRCNNPSKAFCREIDKEIIIENGEGSNKFKVVGLNPVDISITKSPTQDNKYIIKVK